MCRVEIDDIKGKERISNSLGGLEDRGLITLSHVEINNRDVHHHHPSSCAFIKSNIRRTRSL